jgi:hypothetical protein
LTIGTRHLGAVSHEPRAVLLDNRRELIAHDYILAPYFAALRASAES